MQTVAVDPVTGNFEHGGMGCAFLDLSAQILHGKTSPRCKLTADLPAIDLAMTVDDTSAFPATGTVWVGLEAMTYTGKTATTFTGLTRGALGTTAAAHSQTVSGRGRRVYNFNPVLLGRRVRISRWGDIATTRVFTGFIDDVVFDQGRYRIDLINQASRLEETSVGTRTITRATFQGALKPLQNGQYEFRPLGKADRWNALELLLASSDAPFTAMPGGSEIFLKMGSEVIRGLVSTHPAWFGYSPLPARSLGWSGTGLCLLDRTQRR